MTDMLCPDEPVYSTDQIVDTILKLKPELAEEHWNSPSRARSHCCTCIYTRILSNDGKVVELSNVSRIYAGYIRVSTIKQRDGKWVDDDGGIGLRDQIKQVVELCLHYCIPEGVAFRIYTDAGFSGQYPPDDPALIQEMRQTRADIYAEAFREMVVNRCEEPVRQDVQAYLAMRYQQISGADTLPEDMEAIEKRALSRFPLERSFEAIEQAMKMRFNVHKNYRAFRPALHFLLQDLPNIKAACVYDLDRISRNYALSEVLSRRFIRSKVNIYAKTTDAAFATGTTHTDIILRAVHMGGAAEFVRKNLKQIFRSQFAMLKEGKPNGDLPFYLMRDRNKRVIWNPSYLPVIEEMLKGWMDTEDYQGTRAIAERCNALRDQNGNPIPAPKNKYGQWTEPTVRYNMMNPIIYGVMQVWGGEWPLAEGRQEAEYERPLLEPEGQETVPPMAVIAKSQWETTVRARIAKHPHRLGRIPNSTNTQAFTGLLKCRCGASLYYHPRQAKSGRKWRYRDEWACHTSPGVRAEMLTQTGLRWHIGGFGNKALLQFFCDLMINAPQLLQPHAGESLAKLSERHQAMVAARERIRSEYDAEARKQMPAAITPDHPSYQKVLNTILEALLPQDQFAAMSARIERLEAEIKARAVGAQRQTEDVIQDFSELAPERQNEILKSYIKEIAIVSPHGPQNLSGEYLLIRKRDGEELPPIYLKQRMQKNGCPKAALPSFAEWAGSLKAVQPPDGV